MTFRTLDSLDAAGKRVLLRADLNVPRSTILAPPQDPQAINAD